MVLAAEDYSDGRSIMRSAGCSRLIFVRILIVGFLLLAAQAHAAGPLLVAYGDYNETTAPWWVVKTGVVL